MKRCSTCKQTKPLSEFSKNKKFKDGHSYICNVCHIEYMRYYNKLPQAKVARAKSRAKKKAALQALTAQLAEAKRELAETLPKLNSSNRAWLREKENREVAESKRDSYKKALEQIRDIEQGCKDRGVGYNEQVYLMAIDALNLK